VNNRTGHYETLNVLLLNEVQQQQHHIDALERELGWLRDTLTALLESERAR
jgi:hypothetical protein